MENVGFLAINIEEIPTQNGHHSTSKWTFCFFKRKILKCENRLFQYLPYPALGTRPGTEGAKMGQITEPPQKVYLRPQRMNFYPAVKYY